VEDEGRNAPRQGRNRAGGTVVALLAPYLLVLILGGISGSYDMGSREFTFIFVIWAIGLTFVWWPRRTDRGDDQ
jgi:hypothetical protein